MENNLLIETVRIKELMGIESNLISEGIKLPARMLQALQRGRAYFIGDGERMLAKEIPGLPSYPTIDDIITKIQDVDLSYDTVRALLHVDEPQLRNMILNALSDSDEVKRAVNMLNNAIKNNKQSEVDALEQLIKTDFVPESDLDELVQVTTQKIDAGRKIDSRTPIRTVEIREIIQQLDKDLAEFNDKTLVQLWGSKADVRMKARLQELKSQYANLKKDPEFKDAVKFIEEQLNGKNLNFNTKVAEIEAFLKSKHPNAFKRFFYNKYKVGSLIILAALVSSQFDLKVLARKGGEKVKYLFEVIQEAFNGAFGDGEYKDTLEDFKKWLNTQGIPSASAVELGGGRYKLSPTANIEYLYKDGNFE